MDEDKLAGLTEADIVILRQEIKELKKHTDYAPMWVILLIALALGIGTMVGWKRIVKTIGEKIGKEHLTYAQGMTAELSTFIITTQASGFGMPVSTTQVLSSSIAGSMIGHKGIKNLQGGTIKSIGIAWLLTLPVTIVLSGGLFLLLRWIL